MEIEARPVAKFGDGGQCEPPAHSERTRMNGAPSTKVAMYL
jgi:hypothetical protein